jgi:hypothetical protein
MIQVILCVLILVLLIIYINLGIENFTSVAVTTSVQGNVQGNVDSTTFNEQAKQCEFKWETNPHETLFNCTNDCGAMENCDENTCKTECLQWRNSGDEEEVNEKTKSDNVNIRAFSGNKGIKLTWVKPRSMFEITKYYIVLSSKINNLLEVYILEDTSELVKYYITGLENDVIYDVFVIAKNKMGSISDNSNTETIMTRKNSKLNLEKLPIKVGDSLQTRTKNNESNRLNQQPLYSKNLVYNDIINNLTKNLGYKPPEGIYNINIY